MDPVTVHNRRWAILAVLSLSVFLVTVDNTIVNVALRPDPDRASDESDVASRTEPTPADIEVVPAA